MITTIEHKFIENLEPSWDFETLYVGTFNPNITDPKNQKNNAIDFFYGRPKNLFWDVMPKIHNKPSLYSSNKQTKIDFLKENKIAITDLITSVSYLNDKKNEAENKLLTYKDADLNYFIPKNNEDKSVSIKMTDFEKILFNKQHSIKKIILTRQNPLNEKFIRSTWKSILKLFQERVYTVWTPSCWGLKSKAIGLTREEALFNKWMEMLK